MKSFRNILSEVSEPKAGDEKHFKDKHITVKKDHPVADDNVFKGGTKKAPKRIADHDAGEDVSVYEGLDPVNKKAAMGKFKNRADKDIDNDGDVDSSDKYLHARRKAVTKAIHKEEVEDLEEISSDLKSRYAKKAQSSLKRATTYRAKAQDDASKASANIDRANSGDRSVNVNKQYDRIDRADAKAAKHDKTIAKRTAGLKRANEEFDLSDFSVEEWEEFMESAEYDQLDEISKKTLGSYVKKASYDAASNAAKFGSNQPDKKGGSAFVKSHNRLRGIAKATDRLTKEEVELDEATDQERLSARKIQRDAQTARHGIARKPGESMVAYLNRAKKHKEKMQKEEVELDENVLKDKNLMRKAIQKYKKDKKSGFTDSEARGASEYDHRKILMKKGLSKKNAERAAGAIARKVHQINVLGEEVEQLDELSPNTLHSYIKGAGKDLAKRSRMSGYDDKRGNYADGDKNRKKANKRLAGITSASGRLADKANMAENAWEEVPMMMRQLQFIAYAAEEIMEYLDMSVDPDEWYQNKLAHVHDQMQTLHAYAEGDKRMMSKMDYRMYGEEFELDESIIKMSHGRLKFHMNNKSVPHGSYSWDQMKAERDRRLKTGEGEAYKKAKASMSEEADLDEATPTRKALTRALQGMKVQPKDKVSVKKAPWEKNEEVNEVTQSAIKKPVTTTGPDGKTRTVYKSIKSVDRDEHGQEKIRESAELDEAFKVGMVKLNDGGSVILKKEDVDVLNSLFKSLSSTNRKKMESTAMKDKNGFNEILSFAREAVQ